MRKMIAKCNIFSKKIHKKLRNSKKNSNFAQFLIRLH